MYVYIFSNSACFHLGSCPPLKGGIPNLLPQTVCWRSAATFLSVRPASMSYIHIYRLCDDKEVDGQLNQSPTSYPGQWRILVSSYIETPRSVDTHSLVKADAIVNWQPRKEKETAFRFGAGAKRRNRACLRGFLYSGGAPELCMTASHHRICMLFFFILYHHPLRRRNRTVVGQEKHGTRVQWWAGSTRDWQLFWVNKISSSLPLIPINTRSLPFKFLDYMFLSLTTAICSKAQGYYI